MQALPTPAEMSLWDRASIEQGIPEFTLMENASREALHVLQEEIGELAGKRTLLFMGGGNNGGDAACLARHLLDNGSEVLVLHTRPLGSYKGTARRHLRLARACGVNFAPVEIWPQRFAGWRQTTNSGTGPEPDIVVDGLLGTGFKGSLREKEFHLVETINALAAHAFVLAIDIPSGLSGYNGKPQPIAVRASATVTFEAAKPGLILPEAAPYTGKLHIRRIGMPRMVRENHPASFQLIDRKLGDLLPALSPCMHKGTAGSVLILGGSSGLTGAPHLAARAALRTGAGLVTVAAPSALCRDIKANCPDIMTRQLGPADCTEWSPDLLGELLPMLERCHAVVLGPGIGRAPQTMAFVTAFLSARRPAAVIDADALHALVSPQALTSLKANDILTPHPGEAAFVLGTDPATIQSDRFASLDRLRELAPAVWILKGSGTLVGTKGHPVAIAPFAVPNLAVGGSGDVLSGCIGALLAGNRTADALSLACLGVLLHAEAGKLLAQRFPRRGNTASDMAETLPAALAALSAC